MGRTWDGVDFKLPRSSAGKSNSSARLLFIISASGEVDPNDLARENEMPTDAHLCKVLQPQRAERQKGDRESVPVVHGALGRGSWVRRCLHSDHESPAQGHRALVVDTSRWLLLRAGCDEIESRLIASEAGCDRRLGPSRLWRVQGADLVTWSQRCPNDL